jgi:glucokinase
VAVLMIALGLDLGGTKIAGAVVRDGTVLDRTRVETPQTGFADVLDALVAAAAPLLAAHPEVPVVGIGCPGRSTSSAAACASRPTSPAWRTRRWSSARRALGLPVILENDANAAGYAEHRYGAARDLATSVYVTLSTGIGGGIFVGDEVLRGAHGLAGRDRPHGAPARRPDRRRRPPRHLGGAAAGRAIARDASYVFSRPGLHRGGLRAGPRRRSPGAEHRRPGRALHGPRRWPTWSRWSTRPASCWAAA